MKNLILTSTFSVLTIISFAQNVVRENNGRVTVRNANDSILTQIDSVGSRAIAASFNDNKTEIVVTYNNGNVLVKKTDGTIIVQIAEINTDNAIAAIWSDDNIIITTQSNQTLTKSALEWRR